MQVSILSNRITSIVIISSNCNLRAKWMRNFYKYDSFNVIELCTSLANAT